MAVMTDLPGVEVTIQVDEVALKEYEDEDEDNPEKTHIRYVEAVSGKEFKIIVKLEKGFRLQGDSFSCNIYADGRWASTKVLEPLQSDGVSTKARQTVILGFNDFRQITKFRFADLETVSDGRQLKEEALKLRDLGTLEITCYHTTKVGYVNAVSDMDVTEVGIVSEKVLKGRALSHSIGAGSIIAQKTERLIDAKRVSEKFYFKFKYRSKGFAKALRSMLIIPRTPSPPPLEDKDPADITPDDIKELLRRAKEAKELEDTKRKIKRERMDDNPRPRKVSRPSAGDTQLQIDDDGNFREASVATLGREEREVIELD